MRNTTKKPPEVNRKNCADANEARLETPGGALVRKWDETTAVSRHAFLPHFASFLHAGGQFERLVETCPVRYTSPNAPTLNELLATAVAGIVLGLTRYRHFGQLRGDEVAAAAFGVRRMRSCDAVRRFVMAAAKDPAAGLFVEVGEPQRQWEWYALVTNLADTPWTIGPLYRDRGDCENVFDELKNQWGWCGFTVRNLTASAIMAALVAPVANWWNAFARLGEDGAHREATTSRPLLQQTVGKLTRHAGRTELTLFVGGRPETKRLFRQIETAIESTATLLGPERRWRALLLCAMRAYGPFPDAEPPLMGEQFTLALAFPDTG